MQKPITVDDVERTIKAIREVVQVREKALNLILDLANRIQPEVLREHGMLEKVAEFAEAMAAYRVQEERAAEIAAVCNGKAAGGIKPN